MPAARSRLAAAGRGVRVIGARWRQHAVVLGMQARVVAHAPLVLRADLGFLLFRGQLPLAHGVAPALFERFDRRGGAVAPRLGHTLHRGGQRRRDGRTVGPAVDVRRLGAFCLAPHTRQRLPQQRAGGAKVRLGAAARTPQAPFREAQRSDADRVVPGLEKRRAGGRAGAVCCAHVVLSPRPRSRPLTPVKTPTPRRTPAAMLTTRMIGETTVSPMNCVVPVTLTTDCCVVSIIGLTLVLTSSLTVDTRFLIERPMKRAMPRTTSSVKMLTMPQMMITTSRAVSMRFSGPGSAELYHASRSAQSTLRSRSGPLRPRPLGL